jgi:hypothetical protein
MRCSEQRPVHIPIENARVHAAKLAPWSRRPIALLIVENDLR